MRVLVVEDEPELLKLTARALREQGYAVDEAADGEEGLFKAQSWDYQAILLDVMLPRMDGWQLLKALRKSKTTPVLMLTARDQIPDRVRGLDLGADDYLVKPFELPELFARLRALIRRSAGQTASEIVIGDLTVNLANRTVTQAGELVALTAREYGLVELLAVRRGKLVSRTQIYDALFDENESSLSNLLDVHVANIRRKLGRDVIVTRRGMGYMIE